MGVQIENEAKRPGTILLIVPVCPPAWRSHLAEALAPVLNLPVDTIQSRFSDDGPSTLAPSISVDDVDAIEAVFAGQQLRVEWQDKRQGAFELERRWSLIGSALFAVVGVLVFWKAPSTVLRLATIGTVPSASAPSPIRPSWDADELAS